MPEDDVRIHAGVMGREIADGDLKSLGKWWAARWRKARDHLTKLQASLPRALERGRLARLGLQGISAYRIDVKGIVLVPWGMDPDLDKLLMDLDRFDERTETELERRLAGSDG